MTLIPIFTAGGATWIEKNALLYDTFTTDDAAPITSPRTCEPGPGLATIVDTENKLSISGDNLVCAGGKTVPAFGDPSAWLGRDNAGSVDAVPFTVGMAGLLDFTPGLTSKQFMFGFDNDDSGYPKPRFHFNGTTVRLVDSASGTLVDLANGYAAERSKYMIVGRSSTTGNLFIKDGKLLWVEESSGTYAAITLAVFNQDMPFTLHDLALLPLADYNSAWGGDWSEVIASSATPADNANIALAGGGFGREITFTVTRPDPVASAIFLAFNNSGTNKFYIGNGGGTADLLVYDFVGSAITLSGSGVLPAGTSVTVKATITDAGLITVFANGVLVGSGTLTSGADDYNRVTVTSNTGAGEVMTDVSIHPYPALGIATSRVVCPQGDDTFTHSADFVAELKNVTLSSADDEYFRFRYTNSNSYLWLKIEADGGITLLEKTTEYAIKVSAGVGTVSNNDDIVLVADDSNAELFVNGTSVGSTSSLAVTSGISGKAEFITDLTADHIACFPRSVSSLLPKGTF
jgi:hypothetical protein